MACCVTVVGRDRRQFLLESGGIVVRESLTDRFRERHGYLFER